MGLGACWELRGGGSRLGDRSGLGGLVDVAVLQKGGGGISMSRRRGWGEEDVNRLVEKREKERREERT